MHEKPDWMDFEMVIYDFVAVFRRADAVERRRKELAANKYKWLLSKTALQRDHSLYWP